MTARQYKLALTSRRRNIYASISTAFGHPVMTLSDLWPPTLKTFSAVPAHVMNMCGNWVSVKSLDCIRIGPINDHICANITTSQGHCLPWTNEIRYLGTYIAKSRQFRCSIDHAKKSFYRSANSIFGKIGRTATEEVTLELLRTKCIPVLIYGLECFSLPKSDLKSSDFCCHPFSYEII